MLKKIYNRAGYYINMYKALYTDDVIPGHEAGEHFFILLETGDKLLLETGDKFLLE